jgi:hypothetical protein
MRSSVETSCRKPASREIEGGGVRENREAVCHGGQSLGRKNYTPPNALWMRRPAQPGGVVGWPMWRVFFLFFLHGFCLVSTGFLVFRRVWAGFMFMSDFCFIFPFSVFISFFTFMFVYFL